MNKEFKPRERKNTPAKPAPKGSRPKPSGQNTDRKPKQERATSSRGKRVSDNDRQRNFDSQRHSDTKPSRRPTRNFDNDDTPFTSPKRTFSDSERRHKSTNGPIKRKSTNNNAHSSHGPNNAQSGHGHTIRLNKYIANAGICSRREADKLIEAGSVKVNGEVVTQMGYQVKPGDVVSYGGETLSSEAKRYFLMNKPKGYITTVDDPQERKTVMMLIDGACRERIYPVGRLDRNTTGLLLFTNDGEIARKLTHPSTMVYKVYQVELNKAVTRADMKQMLEGIELEDGMIKVDDVQYAEDFNDKRVVGVALHSGRNRIVRRIFEHLGYEVHKLDRVIFAGLTKKDLPRGRYRELTEKEVSFLKMI